MTNVHIVYGPLQSLSPQDPREMSVTAAVAAFAGLRGAALYG